MNQLRLLLFIGIFSFFNHTSLFAQEEIYQPVQISEPLENTEQKTKEEKSKQPADEDAQTALEKKQEKLQRLRIGGNFGLQFGNYTYVNVSPTFGYMVVDNRLELGGGPIMIYQRFRFSSTDAFSFFVYGSDIYARGFLYKGLYLESRYDLVSKPSYFDLDKRIIVHHLLLGAGYAAPIGKIGVFNLSILYNVLNNDESIYRGTFSDKVPIIFNMGFGFGIGGRK